MGNKGLPVLGGITINEQLEKIKNRQGIVNSATVTKGSILGIITALVGGTASKNIFGSDITLITPPLNNTNTWTIDGLNEYNVVIQLNGTGILTEGTDYNIASDTITRVGNFFYNNEVYTLMLIKK